MEQEGETENVFTFRFISQMSAIDACNRQDWVRTKPGAGASSSFKKIYLTIQKAVKSPQYKQCFVLFLHFNLGFIDCNLQSVILKSKTAE